MVRTANDSFRFIAALLRNPASVGAIAPSSRYLAARMVEGIELGGQGVVVEFGPGTGPMTDVIRRRLDNPAAYLGIERDGYFVRLLQQRYPELRFVEGGAEQARRYLREMNGDGGPRPVQAVISGLPFASLPMRVQSRLIVVLDTLLAEGGEFRTFQYLHAWMLPAAVQFRRRMTGRFGPPQVSRPVVRNLPPAVVLSWRKP